jgi:hypothetical protein
MSTLMSFPRKCLPVALMEVSSPSGEKVTLELEILSRMLSLKFR